MRSVANPLGHSPALMVREVQPCPKSSTVPAARHETPTVMSRTIAVRGRSCGSPSTRRSPACRRRCRRRGSGWVRLHCDGENPRVSDGLWVPRKAVGLESRDSSRRAPEPICAARSGGNVRWLAFARKSGARRPERDRCLPLLSEARHRARGRNCREVWPSQKSRTQALLGKRASLHIVGGVVPWRQVSVFLNAAGVISSSGSAKRSRSRSTARKRRRRRNFLRP